MKKFIFALLFVQSVYSQGLDLATYGKFLQADRTEFATIAEAAGFEVLQNAAAGSTVARNDNYVYLKPTDGRSDNPDYELVLGVSTKDKADHKKIIGDATEVEPGLWFSKDKEFVYREVATDLERLDGVWFKIIVFRKRQ